MATVIPFPARPVLRSGNHQALCAWAYQARLQAAAAAATERAYRLQIDAIINQPALGEAGALERAQAELERALLTILRLRGCPESDRALSGLLLSRNEEKDQSHA
jgi:hypothetical protein